MFWPLAVAAILLAQESTIPTLVLKPIRVGVVKFQDLGSQGIVLPEDQFSRLLFEKVDTTRFQITYAASPEALPQDIHLRVQGSYRLVGGRVSCTCTFTDVASGKETRVSLQDATFAEAQQAILDTLSAYSLSVIVTSDPPGGRVTVEGLPVGTTPVEIQNLPPGTYSIAVETQNARKETTLTLNRFVLLNLKLQPVASPPPSAEPTPPPEELPPAKLYTNKSLVCEVWIDGKKVGYTNEGPFEISPGKHTVRCVHPFYGTKEWVIEAKPNEEIHLKYFEE